MTTASAIITALLFSQWREYSALSLEWFDTTCSHKQETLELPLCTLN